MISDLYELSTDAWNSTKQTYKETTYFTKISILLIIITFIIGGFFAFGILIFRGTLNFLNVPFRPISDPKIFN